MQQAGHKQARAANIGGVKYRRFVYNPNNPGIGNDAGFKAVVELVLQPLKQLRLVGHITFYINSGLINKGLTRLNFIRDCAGSYKRCYESAVSYPPNQSKYC